MLQSLVNKLTHLGHRRSPPVATTDRGYTALVRTAAVRAVLLGSGVVSGLVAVTLGVLYLTAVIQPLVADLLLWFTGLLAVAALPSLWVRLVRRRGR